MTKQTRADLLLILVTAFWGGSYFLMDFCLETIGPLFLNALRFLIAFAVLGIVFYKNLKKLNKVTLRYSIAVGLCLVMTYIGATYGLMYTSISNAGFICGLSAVFTPLFSFIIYREKPEKRLLLAVVICTIGLALMTLSDTLTVAKGDIICLLCGIGYAFDLIITDRALVNERVDPVCLGVCELGVTGVVMLLLSFLFETPALPTQPSIWAAVLFLSICCTGIAFVVQTTQQRYTTATRVGLIFTLEPVFSGIVAYFFAGEVLSVRGYIGAVLMIVSILMVEI